MNATLSPASHEAWHRNLKYKVNKSKSNAIGGESQSLLNSTYRKRIPLAPLISMPVARLQSSWQQQSVPHQKSYLLVKKRVVILGTRASGEYQCRRLWPSGLLCYTRGSNSTTRSAKAIFIFCSYHLL